jgi:hypothetical protein
MRFKQWLTEQRNLSEAPTGSLFGAAKTLGGLAVKAVQGAKNMMGIVDAHMPRVSDAKVHNDDHIDPTEKNAAHKAIALLNLLGWSAGEELKVVGDVGNDPHSQRIFVDKADKVPALALFFSSQGYHGMFSDADIEETRTAFKKIPTIKGAVFGSLVVNGKPLPAMWFISTKNTLNRGTTNIAAPTKKTAPNYADIKDTKGLAGVKAKKSAVTQMRTSKGAQQFSGVAR